MTKLKIKVTFNNIARGMEFYFVVADDVQNNVNHENVKLTEAEEQDEANILYDISLKVSQVFSCSTPLGV
jgi:hypothetical protein